MGMQPRFSLIVCTQLKISLNFQNPLLFAGRIYAYLYLLYVNSHSENPMARFSKLALMALCITSVMACSSNEEPTGVIPQGHLDAMDKAKGVEDVLKNAQKKQLEDIDKPG